LLDKENGNTFWRDSIKKEMDNVAVAFELLPKGTEASPMHKHINCKLIFDCQDGLHMEEQAYHPRIHGPNSI